MKHLLFLQTLFYCSSLWASLPDYSEALDAAIQKAPLIFEGKVVDIRYKNSQGNQQHPKGLPHTFVTYKIERVLFGKTDGFFTLRFLGGLHLDGRAMQISHYPQFDIGDHDVLLVDGNNLSGCPLTKCSAGRFRISGEKVFTEEGRVLRKGDPQEKSLFRYGSFLPIPELATQEFAHPKSGKRVVVHMKTSPHEKTQTAEVDQMSASDLHDAIERIKKGQAAQTNVSSANLQQPILAVAILAKAPPQAPAFTPFKVKDAKEAKEIADIQKNGGNPVLSTGGGQ